MEEGYLALKWNNHNTVFTKILNLLREQEAYVDVSLACSGKLYAAHKFVLSTCSEYFKEMFQKNPCKHPIVYLKDVAAKDLEALLDFMYKGEVNVPQSELAALLRTAEGLQVKGLAVPDDTPRTGSGAAALLNKRPVLVPQETNKNVQSMKRKRGSSRDEPPKLTPRPDLAQLTGRSRSTSSRRSYTSPPELKRLRKENHLNDDSEDHSNSKQDLLPPTLVMEPGEVPHSHTGAGDTGSLSDSPKGHGKSSPLPTIKIEDADTPLKSDTTADKDDVEEEEEEDDDEEEDDEEEEDDDDDDNEEEEEEEEEEEDGRPQGPYSDMDEVYEQSNSSIPNSELSTAELLRVDLSEDGTQFIIGPGGFSTDLARGISPNGAGMDDRPGKKRPFNCPICGHTFTRRDNLANHLKTHTGDRPFMCQYCHKCFSRKDYLKQHERIHTGEKPYSCGICGRAFTRKEGLTDHMRCHSDFKAFACEVCGKSFKQKCGLRFHKRNYKH